MRSPRQSASQTMFGPIHWPLVRLERDWVGGGSGGVALVWTGLGWVGLGWGGLDSVELGSVGLSGDELG